MSSTLKSHFCKGDSSLILNKKNPCLYHKALSRANVAIDMSVFMSSCEATRYFKIMVGIKPHIRLSQLGIAVGQSEIHLIQSIPTASKRLRLFLVLPASRIPEEATYQHRLVSVLETTCADREHGEMPCPDSDMLMTFHMRK